MPIQVDVTPTHAQVCRHPSTKTLCQYYKLSRACAGGGTRQQRILEMSLSWLYTLYDLYMALCMKPYSLSTGSHTQARYYIALDLAYI